MRTRIAIALTVPVIAALGALAQAPQDTTQQPTFRAGANYVRVDFFATRDGQPVEDIRREEIELREEGVVQGIDTFEHVKIRPAGSQDSRVDPAGVDASRQMAADPRARVIIIFLDTYHTRFDGSARMTGPLVNFIESVLGPDDLIGIMTPDMSAADLTLGRKTTVMSGIADNAFWGRRDRIADDIDRAERLYELCAPPGFAGELKERRREKLTLDALFDLTVHLNGVREERKAVLVVTEGWRLFGPNMKLTEQGNRPALPPVPGQLGGTGGGRDATGRVLAEDDAARCEADKLALAMIDHTTRVQEIGEHANRTNTSFYTVFARGLAAFDTSPVAKVDFDQARDAATLRARQDSLRTLALETDATSLVNTNDIAGGMRRIAADLSSYYLLGYYSTNAKLDGRFRRLQVRVTRPGVEIRARRGYRALSAADASRTSASLPATSPPSTAVTRAFNALGSVNSVSPVRVRTSTWNARLPGGSALWVVGELDASTRREPSWSAGGRAEVAVMAPDGRQVASTTAEITASDGSFMLRAPDAGGLTPGEYAVRVRVQPTADRSAALTDSLRATIPADASTLGAAIVSRRGPSTGVRYVATADPRFRRTERLRLELPALPAGTASARLLDRNGKVLEVPVMVVDRPDTGGSFRWLVADMSLAPLAAGDYAVEVVLDGSTSLTAFRAVP